MTSLPLLVITIGDIRVRYFAHPDGGPDWPWLAMGDVLRLTRFEHRTQAAFATIAPEEAREVISDDGPVRIVPDWYAYATIETAINFGRVHPGDLDLLKQGTRLALAVLLAEVPVEDWGAWFAAVDARPIVDLREVAP